MTSTEALVLVIVAIVCVVLDVQALVPNGVLLYLIWFALSSM